MLVSRFLIPILVVDYDSKNISARITPTSKRTHFSLQPLQNSRHILEDFLSILPLCRIFSQQFEDCFPFVFQAGTVRKRLMVMSVFAGTSIDASVLSVVIFVFVLLASTLKEDAAVMSVEKVVFEKDVFECSDLSTAFIEQRLSCPDVSLTSITTSGFSPTSLHCTLPSCST